MPHQSQTGIRSIGMLKNPATRMGLQIGVAGLTLVLLMSMGGAIVASPLLVGLLWWTSRGAGVLVRVAFSLLAAAVAVEAFWALAYFIAGEAQPTIWLLPTIMGLVTGVAMFRLTASQPRVASVA